MFNQNGPANFSDIFEEYEDAYSELTVAAGARVDKNLVDTTARTGYGLINVKPRTPHEWIEPGLARGEHVANPVETERTGSSPSHVVLISTRAPEEFNFVSIDSIACPIPMQYLV